MVGGCKDQRDIKAATFQIFCSTMRSRQSPTLGAPQLCSHSAVRSSTSLAWLPL